MMVEEASEHKSIIRILVFFLFLILFLTGIADVLFFRTWRWFVASVIMFVMVFFFAVVLPILKKKRLQSQVRHFIR